MSNNVHIHLDEISPEDTARLARGCKRLYLKIMAMPDGEAKLDAAWAAGVAEPVNTWAGWKAAGYMVEHGAKALFQAVLIHSSKGDGQTYRASFFGASQVQPLEVQ